MSHDEPLGPPPSGPPEHLDSREGRPLRAPSGSRRRRTYVLAAVAGVGAVAAGGAAWAVYGFMQTGAQPAEALPASTIAYASIDLDPSGGQKIEALRTLRKFPAFKEYVGLDTDDDVREWIFDKIQEEADCDGLDFDADVKPWLGDRFALAAVESGGAPQPVFVLQVSDEGAAEDGLGQLRDCAGGSDAAAWAISDGWALVGETEDIVDSVADEAADQPLSEDDDFERWTGEAGDSGIVALYAAPEAGEVIADELGSVDELVPPTSMDDDLVPSEAMAALEDFEGAAATLRFDDGGLELEVAADAGESAGLVNGDDAGEAVASLPEGTAAAFALSLGEEWGDLMLDQVAQVSGQSRDELVAEASESLGLDLPEDAEALAGDAIALAVDEDVDLDSLMSGSEGSSGPVGLGVKVLGDPDDIEGVLDKLRTAAAGEDGGVLDSDADDDAVAVGPDADFRERLLSDEGLGDEESFTRVVEHRDDAAAVLYVDFDAGSGWLETLADDDAEIRANLEPLQALGLSAWLDDDTTHAVVKVTSD